MREAAEADSQICDASSVLSDLRILCPYGLRSLENHNHCIEWQAKSLENLDLIMQAIYFNGREDVDHVLYDYLCIGKSIFIS